MTITKQGEWCQGRNTVLPERTTLEADLRGSSGKVPMGESLLERAMKNEEANYALRAGGEGARAEHREPVWGRVRGRPGECRLREDVLAPSRKNPKHRPTAGSIYLVLKATLTAQGIPWSLSLPCRVV